MRNDDDFDESFGWERDSEEDDFLPEPIPEGLEEIDAADEWLMANDSVDPNSEQTTLAQDQTQERDEDKALEGSITAQEDLAIGGMTEFDAQLGRFGHVEPGIALRAAEFLESPVAQDTIYAGTLGSFSEGGMSLLNSREAFGEVIGQENVGRFISELRKMANDGTTVPSVGRQHLRTAASMLGKTAADYAESGSSLYAADRNEEQRINREAREIEAHNAAIGFAEQYVSEQLPAGPLREKAIEDNYEYIIKRALEHKTSTRSVKTETYTGVVFENVPVTDIRGNLVLDEDGKPSYHTQSRPMVASGIMPLASEMPGLGNLPQQNEWSPRQSLFNEKQYGETASKANYETALRRYEGMVKTLSEGSTTLSDEFRGNTRRYAGQGISHETEWNQTQDFLNEAMLLELERESSDISHSQQYSAYLAAGGGKGSSTGGIYGEKGDSQTDIYIKARKTGSSEDEALAMIQNERTSVTHTLIGQDKVLVPAGEFHTTGPQQQYYDHHGVAILGRGIPLTMTPISTTGSVPVYTEEVTGGITPTPLVDNRTTDEKLTKIFESNISDREKYLARVKAYPQPEQGSQAWKDAAKGDITGSTTLSPDAWEETVEEKAQSLARGEWNTFKGNEATRLGTAMESTVEKYLGEFLTGNLDSDLVRVNKNDSIGQGVKTHKKIIIEEAYREKIKDLPGFSVSPDGYVFDEKGRSLGLAEFKYFSGKESEKSLEGIDPKYMRQMQMQMRGTKEKGVHFFRMSKTGKFAYDYVRPNKELQDAIIKTNQRALDRAEEIKKGGSMISHAEMKDIQDRSDATVYSPVGQDDAPATIFEGGAAQTQASKSVKGSGPSGEMPDYDIQLGGPGKDKTETRFRSAPADVQAKVSAGVTEGGRPASRLKLDSIIDSFNSDEINSMKEEAASADEEAANAAKKKANADKDGAKASREFSKTLKEAGSATLGLVSQLAALGKEGLDTGMTDVRLAAKAGMTSDEARNMRFALEAKGGLSGQESAEVVMKAGRLAMAFNDPTRGVGTYDAMESSLQASHLGTLGGYENMRSKSPSEMLAYHQDRMNQISDPEKRATYGVITGMSNLAISAAANEQVTGTDLLTIKDKVDEVGIRTSQEQYMSADQWAQKKKEEGAAAVHGGVIRAGEGLGAVASIGKNTVALAALTSAVLLNTVAQGGGSIIDLAKKGKTSWVSKALKFGGPALAGIALMTHSEDLGGGLDTMEGALAEKKRTGYLDKLAPVVNVAPIPSKSIGDVNSATKDAKSGLESNVAVNVEINKDDIVTRVDNNGVVEMYVEQDASQVN